MKVRITNNSIRFRLKEPEVEQFKRTGIVTETLVFGNSSKQQLHFSLQKTSHENIGISFHDHHTIVQVPVQVAAEWTDTALVGFDAQVKPAGNAQVYILVEKDFMCMDGRAEDNEGSYPNPLAASQVI